MSTTEDIASLKKIMLDHVQLRNGSDTVKLLWKGYLAALVIEAKMGSEEFHKISESLGDIGDEEVAEIFVGFPGQYN
jgi:hypothetical protein